MPGMRRCWKAREGAWRRPDLHPQVAHVPQQHRPHLGQFPLVQQLDGKGRTLGAAGQPGLSPAAFIALVFVLGLFMAIGKAAVFKHIPAYYPQNVGAVGGMVGMIGGLGGFVLPIAFGWLKDATGLWSSCFMVLFLIVAACFAWMHLTVRRLDRTPAGQPA